MTQITLSAYDNIDPPETKRKPLIVSSSGGFGHIAAIHGVLSYFDTLYKENIELAEYDSILYSEKLSVLPYKIVKRLFLLPQLQSEIYALSAKEKNNGKRKYIDLLLDVCPRGYESVAIWNILQRNDHAAILKKLVSLHEKSDKTNYPAVYSYFLEKLKTAAIEGKPFTEMVSTQVMTLPALCDAVKDYNEWISENKIKASRVFIHEYMTDLPTIGAVHFFNPLSKLTPEQQIQIKLYGVGMNEGIVSHFFPNETNFAGIFNIPSQENPIIRPGFKDPVLDNSIHFDKEVTIELAGKKQYKIAAHEQIASIMLGSQASNDTYGYIEILLKSGMQKVFVFGGKTNFFLEGKINHLIQKHSEYKDRIIPIGNQNDKHIASLMSRSNTVIIRGGGLSVMEQLCMNHNPNQSVFLHHTKSFNMKVTSGIPWEDSNVKALIKALRQRGIYCEKITTQSAIRSLAEARLINAIINLDATADITEVCQQITYLSSKEIQFCVDAFKLSAKNSTSSLPKELMSYFKQREIDAEINKEYKTQIYLPDNNIATRIREKTKRLTLQQMIKKYMTHLKDNEKAQASHVTFFNKTKKLIACKKHKRSLIPSCFNSSK